MTLPTILTVAEAAQLLKCAERTVRTMIQDRRIPKDCIVYISASDKRINITKYLGMTEPTPLHQPATAADVRQIVRDELAGIFRLDRSA